MRNPWKRLREAEEKVARVEAVCRTMSAAAVSLSICRQDEFVHGAGTAARCWSREIRIALGGGNR